MQASSAGLDAKNSTAFASLQAVTEAVNSMQHWQDAFQDASTVEVPGCLLMDVMPVISSAPMLTLRQAVTLPGSSPASPSLPASLLKRKGSSASSKKASRGQTDGGVRTMQGQQARPYLPTLHRLHYAVMLLAVAHYVLFQTTAIQCLLSGCACILCLLQLTLAYAGQNA